MHKKEISAPKCLVRKLTYEQGFVWKTIQAWLRILLILDGRCDRYFWDIRLKIYRLPNVNMLFQFLVTKFFKSEKTYLLSNLKFPAADFRDEQPTNTSRVFVSSTQMIKPSVASQNLQPSPTASVVPSAAVQRRVFHDAASVTQESQEKPTCQNSSNSTGISESVLSFGTFDTSSIKRNMIERRIISRVKIQVLQITTGHPTGR